MKYDELSNEAKETLQGMVEYCINHGIGMGMDEGILVFADECVEEVKHPFRRELEAFCGMDKAVVEEG